MNMSSYLKGTNLEALCEAVMIQAEVQELTADQTGLVEGVIVECKVDKGMGWGHFGMSKLIV